MYNRGPPPPRGRDREPRYYEQGRPFQGRGQDDRSRSRDRGPQGNRRQGGNVRPTSLQVRTNVFQLKFRQDGSSTLYHYNVEIDNLRRLLRKDAEGNPILDEQGNKQFDFSVNQERKPLFDDKKDKDKDDWSSIMTRRILLQVQADLKSEGKYCVTDGSANVYAANRLFDSEHGEKIVKVLAECESTHPFAKYSSHKWFQVTFTQVNTVDLTVQHGRVQATGAQAPGALTSLLQATNIALNNASIKAMVGFGPRPKLFFFPEHYQNKNNGQLLLGRKTASHHLLRSSTTRPMLGISQSAHLTRDGQMNVVANLGLQWMQRGHWEDGSQIAVVQPDRTGPGGTIAGVHVPNLQEHVPKHLQSEVENALSAICFDALSGPYGQKWKAEFTRQLREKNVPEEEIPRLVEQRGQTARLNKRVWRASEGRIPIHFTPRSYQFSVASKDGQGSVQHTVETYNRDVRDIQLRYPYLPVVHINEREVFPVEKLYYVFDKLKVPPTEEQKKVVLGFHDEFAAQKSIEHATDVQKIGDVNDLTTRVLEQLNLKMDAEPKSARANVLREPTLEFSERSMANMNDGSWNLRGKRFNQPARFTSFAVVDLTGGGSREIIQGLFQTGSRHGLILGHGMEQNIELVTVRPTDTQPRTLQNAALLQRLSEEAIQKASQFFLLDSSGFFKRHCVFCQTLVRFGVVQEDCLVFPPHNWPRTGPDHVRQACIIRPWTDEVVFDENKWHPNATHLIGPDPNNPKDVYQARIVVSGKSRSGEVLKDEDLFGVADVVRPDTLVWGWRIIDDSRKKVCPPPDEVYIFKEVWPVKDADVDCPSLLFAVLPKEDKQVYSVIDNFARIKGVQKQVIVKAKYDQQSRNPSPYFAGIALKLNGKLSSHVHHASAWKTETQGDWISESPTLIIGLAASSEQGKVGKMVVAGSACLDKNSGLRMCHEAAMQIKDPILSSEAIDFIVKSLALQFKLANGETEPERVVVYRETGHDGLFNAMIEKEVPAVKQALAGRLKCEPKLTYVVAQNNAGICVAPADDRVWQKINVPSGTCINNSSVLFGGPDTTTTETGDFLLVPQGGLKGTSRSVYYKTIHDENSVDPGKLSALTYNLSFQYTTASKAPRELSVLKYSNRLANRILAGIPYFFDSSEWSIENGLYKRNGDPPDPRLMPAYSPFDENLPFDDNDPLRQRPPFRSHLAG